MSLHPSLTNDHPIFLSFYGDDFTGSTDVMEALALNGIPTALFLEPPTPEEIQAFRLKNTVSGPQKTLAAVGVAGISRSLSPQEMNAHLPPIFDQLSQIDSTFFHYKVCSTFDSSPQVGSIGHAIDLAYPYFPSDYIPLLVGAPSLNRFCVFGNLFARVDEITYRIDRHPTMSRHPVTPMHESDLRLHLAKQTNRPVQLMDLFALESDETAQNAKLKSLLSHAGEYLLFDTYHDQHLLAVGRILWERRKEARQLLVGSSGTEYALCQYLQQQNLLEKPPAPVSAGEAQPVIVMAGSCSPTTGQQLQWAIRKGFADIRIRSEALVHPEERDTEMQRVEALALTALSEGKHIALYTAQGPDDPSIAKTNERKQTLGLEQTSTSALLASAQGKILKSLLEQTQVQRVVSAGGDTSGYIARELGIYALETLMPIAPGVPLCTAHAHHPRFDGLQIAMKGGQNGKTNYFESIVQGRDIS
uniref:Four-carbon acid sugar kinase family protein n=1 Tax=Roseihalotalea indica TaxID=2867963 RepID=A0AA49JHT6_9BACT|nr:four-carbon acid sugar kinase family protein [Tunicatimonas sp. TK19036]